MIESAFPILWTPDLARVADPDGNVVIIGARGEMVSDG